MWTSEGCTPSRETVATKERRIYHMGARGLCPRAFPRSGYIPYAGETQVFARPPSLALALEDAEDVTLGVGEERERDHVRDFGDRHHRLAAALLDLVEVRLWVVDLDVDGDVALPVLGVADTAADPSVVGRDHAVVRVAGTLLVLP